MYGQNISGRQDTYKSHTHTPNVNGYTGQLERFELLNFGKVSKHTVIVNDEDDEN
jgi:hypothetical protein